MKLIRIWLLAAVAACGSSQTPEPEPEPTPVAEADAAPAEHVPDEAEQVAAIEWTVNETAEAVFACYKRATAENFRMEGRVTVGVEFTDGKPKAAVVEDEPKSAFLSRCLVDVFTEFPWPKVFQPGQSIALPFSFVAAEAQYTVERAHVPVTEVAPGVKLASILTEDSTGNAAAAVSFLAVERGAGAPLHEHDTAELLYIVQGGGTMYEAAGKDKAVEVGAGTAIYIAAGVAHGFDAGPEGVQAVQLRAPGATRTTPVSDKDAKKRARKRRRPMPLAVKLADAKLHEIAGGKATVAIVFDKASAKDDAAYLGIITAQPGLKIPEHVHDSSTELLYVLSGQGRMTVKDQTYPVAPNMAIQVPPNTKHSFEVTSDEPVVAVQFYTPSGPEQRFKQ